jgi:hypothetical protein
MPNKCPHCGQDLPAPKEEFDPGFNVVPVEPVPFNDRYDAIRREIELSRRNLRDGGWQRLYKAILELVRLSPDFTWTAVCRTIFNKSRMEVLQVLEEWSLTEQLAEIGFDEKLLRGPEEVLNYTLNHKDPRTFNVGETKKAINKYQHFQMWKRKCSL